VTIVVVDASTVVAALISSNETGRWAESLFETHTLTAPHLMPIEVANILRRSVIAGDVSVEVASLAHQDLLMLRVELFPYAPFAERVWELRNNVTAYDAWYVALAEHLAVSLATADTRLARSVGPKCAFETPP
jgi:predicted nucleic acid-binding protein